jgi:hypothetical protein
VSAVRRVGSVLRAHAGVAAIASLGIAWGLLMHSAGWAQLSYYAQTRALASGQAEIDRWHWETKDAAWVDGHYYSVKAPGLAALTLPLYAGLDGAGAQSVARDAAASARSADHPRWVPLDDPPLENFGYDALRALRTELAIERGVPMIWALTLFGAVLPAIGLLLLVRWVGERIEPGYGTAAAITLGIGTIVMTFAAEYFSHVVAAALGFAAFALLFREREGPPRLGLVGTAGLLAGLAVSFEYPLGLLGAVLFVYALAGPRRLRRGAAYAAGATAGAAPALLYNLWALGSPFRFAYSDAISVRGLSGHDELGLNSAGLFGIDWPRPEAALDLLLSSRGLLTLTPVLAMGLVGAWLIRRRGRRAEANVILAVTAVYFLYNSGYWLPLGGGTPGPRFLTPILPFLAVGLAAAYRRFPALTLGLAIPSATMMVAATLTFPLIGENGTWVWVERLRTGNLEHTLLTALGVGDGWLAVLPVLGAIAIAAGFAAVATPRTRFGGLVPFLAALAAWAAASAVGPTLAGDPVTPLDEGGKALQLVALGIVASVLTLLVLRHRERRQEPAPAPLAIAGERIS